MNALQFSRNKRDGLLNLLIVLFPSFPFSTITKRIATPPRVERLRLIPI